ncbi:hypothetical protein ASPCAL03741 [Aspergillus calidoustus]|uniref:Metallo-beta-lactamase domain-containing protein n=1 Tax=Aspergillus calidoustus TaxID=454130 RepID=A0A0U5FVE4_ASPCI|nr:hypothetical protein ASPCAL03741 [Aspergillus calidoustus]
MSSTRSLNIPASKSTVQVSIIDTTFDAKFPAAYFMGPPIKGFDELTAVAYAFLVKHVDSVGEERSIVFDLGTPKDVVNDFPPKVAEWFMGMGFMRVEKYVSEILEESNVALDSIEAIIWSHAHMDHVGRPSLFPTTAKLIVGPGIKQAFFPGYPTAPDSQILSREFAGREVAELSLPEFSLDIGGLKALDYFGDGSFYLLSAPGHAIGHLNALARTTDNTFLYLAGDSVHHLSELRPHAASHLPQSVALRGSSRCCPGAAFHAIHPLSDITKVPDRYHEPLGYPDSTPDTAPFFTISQTPTGESLASDVNDARATIKAVQRFDADENVFVVAAHDASIRGILDLFPRTANDWKVKGLKEAGRWLFLDDFEEALRLAGENVGDSTRTA